MSRVCAPLEPFVCNLCGGTVPDARAADAADWDWFMGYLPDRFCACGACRKTRQAEVDAMLERSKVNSSPHPNDKQAQIRKLRRELRRAENYQPSTAVLDAMARGALEAARTRIDELEAEVAELRAAINAATEGVQHGSAA